MNSIKPSSLLIADPFLKDPNFKRAVIFLCSHDENGSLGFKLNELFEYGLNELINGLEQIKAPVFVGGPVGMDTIHFIHQYPNLIPNSQLLTDEICWGGDFDVFKELLLSGDLDMNKIKFFIGHSGWSHNQLEAEIEDKSWIIGSADKKFLFEIEPEFTWQKSIKNLGGDYLQLLNYPIDPQLN
jgi:putative transcriptional regulator